MSHRGYFDKFSPLPSLDEFCQLRHVVRQDVGGPQPGEVLVGVEGGEAGHLAAPLRAELHTESLQGPHSAPDKDGATCKYSSSDIDVCSSVIELLCG